MSLFRSNCLHWHMAQIVPLFSRLEFYKMQHCPIRNSIPWRVDKIENLKPLYSEINIKLNNIRMTLHKWCSNPQSFLNDISHQQVHEYDLNLDNACNKILGLNWHPQKGRLDNLTTPVSCWISSPKKNHLINNSPLFWSLRSGKPSYCIWKRNSFKRLDWISRKDFFN